MKRQVEAIDALRAGIVRHQWTERRLKELGHVSVKRSGDLLLFNYTPKAVYEGRWNNLEMISRGLIIHCLTGEVIARPFDKFFNWGEQGFKTSSPIDYIQEKMDGSLGILYRQDGQLKIATRGSFDSPQAQWATNFLKYHDRLDDIPHELTLLFEIIYPGNRVVMNYKGTEALFLLAARNRFTGEYLPLEALQLLTYKHGFLPPKVYRFSNINELIARCENEEFDDEGFVAVFEDGTRFKFKGINYLRLHKAISALSPKNTLQAMRDGYIHELFDSVPDEFLDDVNRWVAQIETTIEDIQVKVNSLMRVAPNGTRKEFAQWVMNYHKQYAPYLFAKLDGKDILPMIYQKHNWDAVLTLENTEVENARSFDNG